MVRINLVAQAERRRLLEHEERMRNLNGCDTGKCKACGKPLSGSEIDQHRRCRGLGASWRSRSSQFR